jgi:hypothetical protein
MKKNKESEVAMPVQVERKAEVRVTIPPEKKGLASKLNGLKIGKRLVLEITGKIVALNMDSYETSCRLEITALDAAPSMGHQIEQLKESRTDGR